MTPNHFLIDEHVQIRRQIAALEGAVRNSDESVPVLLNQLQASLQRHFREEDIYYRTIDTDGRVPDRGAMHTLRNDHAAVIFSLESLSIRLRKNGVNDEWRGRFKAMRDVLLPHFDLEESFLMPLADQHLSPAEKQSLLQQMKSHD